MSDEMRVLASEYIGTDGRSHWRVTGGNCGCGASIMNEFEWRLHLSKEECDGRQYAISVRPWDASGGSSVHDETVFYHAKNSYHALMQLYKANEYDWAIWRVIDVAERKP